MQDARSGGRRRSVLDSPMLDLMRIMPLNTKGFDPAVVAKKGKRTLLGHGAFASVYKMEYRWPNGIKQTMAVKVLQKGLLRDANKAEDLAYEVRILSGCSSPGVVQFLGWGVLGAEAAAAETMALGDLLEADAEPFLAQEYLEGGTLKDAILEMMSGPRKRPYDWLDAFRWMIDVAEGLSYLHERDPLTIHRDVKPENILLTSRERKQSRAKITDFGLAKLVQLDPTEGPMTRIMNGGSMAAPKRPRPIGRLEYICQTENTNSSGRARSEYREWRERQERGEGGSMRRAAQAPGLRTIHERPSPALAPKVRLDAKEEVGNDRLRERLERISGGQTSYMPQSRRDLRRLSRRSVGRRKTQRMMAATAMTGGTGSALYMAPEVFLNEAYDERCDVFSFGMVFYEVLRGTLGLAFLDYGADGLENATVTYAKRVASGWRPEIPAEWPSEVKELVSKMLQQDSAARPSFTEIVSEMVNMLMSGVIEHHVHENQQRGGSSGCQCCSVM